MFPKICSVSVDLDTLKFYHRIHGLHDPSVDTSSADPVYTIGLPRLLDLFEQCGIRATFFVIGEDVLIPAHRKILQEAVAMGHELANHTYSHPYGLTQLPFPNLKKEIEDCQRVLEEILPDGERVLGFRCPGYTITPQVLEVLRENGYVYDSSVFPSPTYYLAKAAVMTWLQLRKKPSKSVLGSPRVLTAPATPYRVEQSPYQATSQGHLWELPIAPIPYTGLPYIGTSLAIYPPSLLHLATKLMCRKYSFLNLEFHGIDVLDPSIDPHLEKLRPVQPDLRVPLERKLQQYKSTFYEIQKTHRFLPLVDYCTLLARET